MTVYCNSRVSLSLSWKKLITACLTSLESSHSPLVANQALNFEPNPCSIQRFPCDSKIAMNKTFLDHSVATVAMVVTLSTKDLMDFVHNTTILADRLTDVAKHVKFLVKNKKFLGQSLSSVTKDLIVVTKDLTVVTKDLTVVTKTLMVAAKEMMLAEIGKTFYTNDLKFLV